MTKEYIFSGKTTDAAIDAGLAELGLDRDDVSVEILQMPEKGFLGIGAKKAEIKITVTLPDEKPAKKPRPEKKKQDKPKAEKPVKTEKPAKPQAEKPAKPQVEKEPEEKLVAIHQMPGESISPKRVSSQKPAANKEKPVKAEKPAKPKAPKPEKIIPAEQLEAAGAACKAFLEETLAVMQINSEITVSTENNMVSITLTGDGMGLIIGRRGETLDALQQLTSLVANKEKGDYIKVMLDTEGYREKREQALISVAKRTAAKAVKYKKDMRLEPMNPYERRIIHSALQGYPNVTTKSVGSEPNRKVVICYVK